MMRTDHDKCLYIIHKYMIEHPSVFSVDQPPSYGIKPGYDLVAKNLCMDVVEHVEVELDATGTKKFSRIAEKGKNLYLKHDKPVRLWMVSTSDKWIRGVKKAVSKPEAPFNKRISVQRISPSMLEKDVSYFSISLIHSYDRSIFHNPLRVRMTV